MPLIPSYIARLRTHSQSTAATSGSSSHSGSRSTSTAGPPTPAPEFARLAIDPPVAGQVTTSTDVKPHEQVARKIHPDLNALLDENAPAHEVLGPRPPRGRSQSAGQLASMKAQGGANKESEIQGVHQTDAETTVADATDTPAPSRSPFLARILSAPLLGGVRSTTTTTPVSNPDVETDTSGLGTHWSTFGRRRLRASAVGELGSLYREGSGSKSSAKSKGSKRATPQRSTTVTPTTTRPPSARTSTPSRAQTIASTIDTPPSQPDSPVGTLSSSSGSKSYSQRSQSAPSRRYPQSYPQPIPDLEPLSDDTPQTPPHAPFQGSSVSPLTPTTTIISPRPTKPHLDDSPHTFGRVTPKRSGADSKPHPGLSAAFLPPSTSTPPPPPSPEHSRQHSTRRPPSTYPPRSRKRSLASGSAISFPVLPLNGSFTHSNSRPRVEDVFQEGDHERRPSTLGFRFGLGSLLGGEEGGLGRRTSADWSATEAIRDNDSGDGETWPATVSREMVRMSLGHRSGSGNVLPVPVGSGKNMVEAEEVGILKEGGTKNLTLFGSTGEDRWKFLGRKRTNTSPALLTDVNASPSRQQVLQPLKPAFSASPPPTSKSTTGGLAVSVIASTPSSSPSENRMNIVSDSGPKGSGDNSVPNNTVKSQGKRKQVDSEDEAPSHELTIRSILLSKRDNSTRISDASHAPSSFRQSKRIRLSTPSHSPPHDLPSRSLISEHQSPPGSPGSRPPSSIRTLPANAVNPRTSSQSSIPLRAIVSPRPPSIDRRSAYHMRDPDLPPPRRQSTQWTGGARKREEGRRAFPLQGWAFILGFFVFPLWWIAAAAPVGWGWSRKDVGVQDGKSLWSEEDLAAREIMEYDVAYTWRQRCRLMSLLGLLVYIPLIVLLSVFIPRT